MIILFSLFRLGFIGVLHQYLNEATTIKEIMVTLYYGLPISLKSACLITGLAEINLSPNYQP